MPGWMLVTAAALGVAVVAGVVAMAIAARHWKVATVDLSERLMGECKRQPLSTCVMVSMRCPFLYNDISAPCSSPANGFL